MKTWLILFRQGADLSEEMLSRLERHDFRIQVVFPPFAVIGEAPDALTLPETDWPEVTLVTADPVPEDLAPGIAPIWNSRFSSGEKPFEGLNWDSPGFQPPH